MSDTPETDNLEVQLGQAAMHSHPILWEHSRRMERERDRARKLADEFHQDQTRLILERDQAREALREAIQFRDTTLNGYDLDAWLKAAGLTK